MKKYILSLLFFSVEVFGASGGEGVPVKTVIAQGFNVILFICILVFLLRKKIPPFFQQRQEAFLVHMHKAQKQKEESEKQKKIFKDRLLDLEQKWEKNFEDVRREAETQRKKALEESREQASRTLEEAQKTVALEKQKVKNTLKNELFEEAYDKAQKKLSACLDSENHKELRKEFFENAQVVL